MAKAIRVIEYSGSEEWLEATLKKSISYNQPLKFQGFYVKEIMRRTYRYCEEPKSVNTIIKSLLTKPEQILVSITEIDQKGGEGQ